MWVRMFSKQVFCVGEELSFWLGLMRCFMMFYERIERWGILGFSCCNKMMIINMVNIIAIIMIVFYIKFVLRWRKFCINIMGFSILLGLWAGTLFFLGGILGLFSFHACFFAFSFAFSLSLLFWISFLLFLLLLLLVMLVWCGFDWDKILFFNWSSLKMRWWYYLVSIYCSLILKFIVVILLSYFLFIWKSLIDTLFLSEIMIGWVGSMLFFPDALLVLNTELCLLKLLEVPPNFLANYETETFICCKFDEKIG